MRLFIYLPPSDSVVGGAAAVWCVSALADVSNELPFQRSQYQTPPSTPVVYPRTDLCEVDASACSSASRFKRRQAFWGCAHICSLPLPLLLFLPFSPSCSPFQVFPGVCESLSSPSSSFQVETGGSEQPGSFPLLFIHFLLVCCVAARSISLSRCLPVSSKLS